jgi:hypothetical protein
MHKARMARYYAWQVRHHIRTIRRALSYARTLPPVEGHELEREGRSRGQLEELFDANLTGPGVWKWRHYFPAYERHLAGFVGRPVRVIEIGIFSGGSLGMWRKYFGDDSQIIGVDIEPVCRSYARDGIEVVIGDQADPGFWAAFCDTHAPVDIVIDDGGHLPHQQIAALEMLLPHIRPGGVYLCEDIQGERNTFHTYIDALTRTLSAFTGMGPIMPHAVHHHVESVHRYPQLIVIEKPSAPVEWFDAPKHGTEWQPNLADEALYPPR